MTRTSFTLDFRTFLTSGRYVPAIDWKFKASSIEMLSFLIRVFIVNMRLAAIRAKSVFFSRIEVSACVVFVNKFMNYIFALNCKCRLCSSRIKKNDGERIVHCVYDPCVINSLNLKVNNLKMAYLILNYQYIIFY